VVGIGWLVLISIGWAVQYQFLVCGCWQKKNCEYVCCVCVGGGGVCVCVGRGGGFVDPCHAREYQLGVPSRYWGSHERIVGE
jgi:hypothetical protein